jgi:hypothetical protein
MENVNYNDLIGKTIISIEQKKLVDADDDGFLELKFSDGSKITIVAEYGGYTGMRKDEYPTQIYIVKDYYEELEPI